MIITGTHINYYFVCQRKLWLFDNGIQMEHTSELVDEGRFIHETTYPQRAGKNSEIELDGVKIDYYDLKNKIVHEVKKSNKVEEAHRWQVKYYLLVLARYGVKNATAILEYPKLRRKEEIHLKPADEEYLNQAEYKISEIIYNSECPPPVHKRICRNCSYFDFCWCEENI
jgi:CRISPR-associated exonuclease Cas4